MNSAPPIWNSLRVSLGISPFCGRCSPQAKPPRPLSQAACQLPENHRVRGGNREQCLFRALAGLLRGRAQGQTISIDGHSSTLTGVLARNSWALCPRCDAAHRRNNSIGKPALLTDGGPARHGPRSRQCVVKLRIALMWGMASKQHSPPLLDIAARERPAVAPNAGYGRPGPLTASGSPVAPLLRLGLVAELGICLRRGLIP